MDDIDKIWEDINLLLPSSDVNRVDNNLCNCSDCLISSEEGEYRCEGCGLVIKGRNFVEREWNNYTNDDGAQQKNTQRADLGICDNPYDKKSTVPGLFKNNKLAMRLHYQQIFTHKQKVFWQTSGKLENYIVSLNLPISTLDTSKHMWHIYMESGVLTRASVRSGIIGCCLYYSCIYNNVSINREKLIENIDGNNKGFLKGEKIFCEIIGKSDTFKSVLQKRTDIKEDDSFIKYIRLMDLPYSYAHDCNTVYINIKDYLDIVTPKSAIAGILYHVIKNLHNLKRPSKTKVSEIVGVCIPTVNKVLNIIKKNID